MKIRPLYIVIRNYASFGNKKTKIEFPDIGESMLILGEIGSGKSSIFNALFWCVTGKKLDNSQTVINTVNKKNLYVECAWAVPWQSEPLIVKRGMKPSLFEVSGLDGTIQTELKKEFGRVFPLTDPQVLLNLCLLSVAKSLPFFGLDKQKRLSFLRNFIDTDKLDELSLKAKDKNLSCVRDSEILSRELSTMESQLGKITQEIESIENINVVKKEELSVSDRLKVEEAITLYECLKARCEADKEHIAGNTTPIEDELLDREYPHPSEYIELETAMNEIDIEKVREEKGKVDEIANVIKTRINLIENNIATAERDMETIESLECKKYFKEDIEYNKSQLDKLRADLKTILTIQQNSAQKLKSVVEKRESIITKQRKIVSEVNNYFSKVVNIINKFNAILSEDDRNRVENAKENSNIDTVLSLKKLHSELVNNIDEKKLEFAKMNRMAQVSKEYRKILDSTWGYMAAKMVPYLNSRMPFYMEKLGINFSMQFDTRDISKPIFRGRPGIGELKLNDLSTGQKRVLSICLAHSLRDMYSAQSATEIGFLLVDELSGNLNHELVDILMDFEFSYAKDNESSLVLVTHDVALQQRDEWTKILKVEKDVFTSVKYLK